MGRFQGYLNGTVSSYEAVINSSVDNWKVDRYERDGFLCSCSTPFPLYRITTTPF